MSVTFEKVNYIYSPDTPFSYHALKDVDLCIEKGSFTALIGHTGSGKSTLLQHMNALLVPNSGTVQIDDFLITATNKPKGLKELRKKTGLVFQFPEYQLFEETVAQDISFGPMNFGMSKEDALEKAKEALHMVGLAERYLERSPFEMSGGQKRRVAIAGILAMDPDILVLDEPAAGLDPQGAKDMLTLFKSLQKAGKTIIMVSHDMNHVLQYCDRVVVMNRGRIERHCSVDELFYEKDFLRTLSIELPIITQFIEALNEKGYHLDHTIKDVESLVTAIGGELRE